jgi:hypothetical protein
MFSPYLILNHAFSSYSTDRHSFWRVEVQMLELICDQSYTWDGVPADLNFMQVAVFSTKTREPAPAERRSRCVLHNFQRPPMDARAWGVAVIGASFSGSCCRIS